LPGWHGFGHQKPWEYLLEKLGIEKRKARAGRGLALSTVRVAQGVKGEGGKNVGKCNRKKRGLRVCPL
jgi:hypothetical protein